jgi:hypothetical protein
MTKTNSGVSRDTRAGLEPKGLAEALLGPAGEAEISGVSLISMLCALSSKIQHE